MGNKVATFTDQQLENYQVKLLMFINYKFGFKNNTKRLFQ